MSSCQISGEKLGESSEELAADLAFGEDIPLNMKLFLHGTGSWTTDSPRFVDAWGAMRTGSAGGGSPMCYCASLGHLQDDESGLIYMRAIRSQVGEISFGGSCSAG